MKKSNTQSISDVLKIFFKENPQLSQKLAETRLMNSWGKVLNPAVLRYTGQLFVKNKCLYVKINSSIVKSELIMRREQLIQDLNREAGEAVITQINFL
jgi:coproporphyrinogen III oxidase-like Fe-S oxidoreductase